MPRKHYHSHNIKVSCSILKGKRGGQVSKLRQGKQRQRGDTVAHWLCCSEDSVHKKKTERIARNYVKTVKSHFYPMKPLLLSSTKFKPNSPNINLNPTLTNASSHTHGKSQQERWSPLFKNDKKIEVGERVLLDAGCEINKTVHQGERKKAWDGGSRGRVIAWHAWCHLEKRRSLDGPWQYRSYQSAILSRQTARNGRSLGAMRTKQVFRVYRRNQGRESRRT